MARFRLALRPNQAKRPNFLSLEAGENESITPLKNPAGSTLGGMHGASVQAMGFVVLSFDEATLWSNEAAATRINASTILALASKDMSRSFQKLGLFI
jgi:hypothetical protein